LSFDQRADDLLSRLTLEEKASLMQHASPAIERLGIPQFNWWSEALHGVARNGVATVFPITMGMAASFNTELLYEVFNAVSDEARAKNNEARRNNRCRQYEGLSFWTPNINIFRDPRWGRGQETYGEDPFLTAQMGSAVVHGLQGTRPGKPNSSPYYKLYACAKHFAVHSGPEWNRHSFNVEDLSLRDLFETYLPAFKALVQEAGVKEIMCAYQRFDGQPCCGSNQLLQQILRKDWGFKDMVTSDCWAVSDFWKPGFHGFSDTRESAVAHAVRTGTDLECGQDYRSLPEAVRQGKVTEAEIDVSLHRLLRARFELGDFDSDELVPWRNLPLSIIASPEHKQLALEMARQSIVLLQNRNNILPLSRNRKIAVIGPNANDAGMLWGNYNGFPSVPRSLLDGLRDKCPDIMWMQACTHTGRTADERAVVAAVADADIVIFIGGISPRLEGEEMDVNAPGFKGGDRTSIELPKPQRDILAALHRAGKHVVYVNCSGSAIALEPETRHADAIVQAWYGGEAGPEALADVLFGDYNPSGKLPVTFYRNTEQLPDYEDYAMKGRTYRYFTGSPLYPFGYGLSYTTFACSKPVFKRDRITVSVKNTGNRDGDEIVQVYLRRPADVNGPIKALRGFQRVHLKAGEQATVTIPMPRARFETWDEATNTMRVVPGQFQLMVGTSSRDADLQTIDVKIK
jgi:beta-glucosidase